MLINILIGVASVIALLFIVAAFRPSDFRVARSTAIAAPPAEIFARVNSLRRFQQWSPFSKIDPAAKVIFEGPATGVGSSMTWKGNNKAGEGRMTCTESCPSDRLRFRLDFLRPFKATNTAEFSFQSEGTQTVVTWSMSGHNNLMFKVVGLFMNCDKMIGSEFEKGLTELKAQSEATEVGAEPATEQGFAS